MNPRGLAMASAVSAIARGKIKLNNEMRSWFKCDLVGSWMRGSEASEPLHRSAMAIQFDPIALSAGRWFECQFQAVSMID
jgi:hypothetical protein